MISRQVVIAAGCALGVLGCTLGPGWVPEIAGRVIDEGTRAPVAGAEVFVSFRIGGPMMSPVHAGSRWSTTDAEGRFSIAAYREHRLVPFAATSDLPILIVYHPAYGRANKEFGESFPFPGWRSLELPIRVNPVSPGRAKEPDPGEYFCIGLDSQGCRRMRVVVYGEAKRP